MKSTFFILILSTWISATEPLSINEKQIERLGVLFAQPEPLEETFSAPWLGLARVMPADEYRLTLPLDVMIQTLYIIEGQQVEEGQVLMDMESRELRLWANHLLSAYDEHRQCEDQVFKLTRRLELGLATESELNRQKKDCALASHVLDSAKASLQHAGWSNEAIEQFLEKRQMDDSLTLKAPVSGIVYRLPIMPGNHLEPGSELCTIWPSDKIKLQLKLPPSRVRHLKVGQSCTLEDDRSAKIEMISNIVSKDNRISVLLSSEELIPGERIHVRLPTQQGQSWLLPTRAVVRHDQKDWIFKKTDQGITPIEVVRGAADNRMVQISAQIEPDDEFVIQGTAAIKGLWLGLGGE